MKTKLKRTISTALVMLTALSSVSVGALPAGAKTQLSTGKAVTVSVKSSKKYDLEFTPKTSGSYVFYSKGKAYDPRATLYLSENGKKKKIAENDDSFTQKSVHFEIYANLKKGNKYILSCETSDYTDSDKYQVAVKKSSVKSVELKLKNPISIIECDNEYGTYKTKTVKGKKVKYFEYDIKDFIFRNGNKIVVSYSDGKKPITYTYDYNSISSCKPYSSMSWATDVYATKDGVALEEEEISVSTSTASSAWATAGKTYYAAVSCFGKTCKVPVKIEKTPVKSIKFKSAQKYNCVGSTSKIQKTAPDFSVGDELSVTYNDKRGTVKYRYSLYYAAGKGTGEYQFIDEYSLPIYGVNITKAYKKNGKLVCKVSYLKKTVEVPVKTVAKNDISVSFSSKYGLTALDNYYDSRALIYAPGNSITVKDKKGKTVYKYDEKTDEFISKDGYRLTSLWYEGAPQYITVEDNQGSKDNYITLTVYGKSVKLKVKIIDCKHKNTTKVKAVPATCTENGLTAATYCNDCHKYLNEREIVDCYHNNLYKLKIKFTWSGNKATVSYVCPKCHKVAHEKNDETEVTKKVISKATTKQNGKIRYTATFFFDGYITDTKTVTVNKIKSIKLSSKSFKYNKKVQKPTVTVTDAAGKKLKNKTDYTVTYSDSNSKAVGKYTATVKFTGNYSGTKKLTYEIRK